MTFFSSVASTSYKKYVSGKEADLLIANDGVEDIYLSLNSNSVDTIILAGESLELRNTFLNEVYLKTNVNTTAFRLWFFGTSKSDTENVNSTQVAMPKTFIKQNNLL